MKHLLAGGAEEGLFWFVMAIIWVVVQIVSRVTKKQLRRGAPPRPAPAAQPDASSLEDFLRSLGAEPALPPSPATGPAPEPVRVMGEEEAPSPIRTRKRKKPRPLAPPAPVPVEAFTGPVSGPPAATPEVDVSEAARQMRGMLVIPKIPVVNVQGLRVPGLAFQGNTISNLRPGPDRFPLKGRATLRKAMLYRLILEPPHHSS